MFLFLKHFRISTFSFLLILVMGAIMLLFSSWGHAKLKLNLRELAGLPAFNTAVANHEVLVNGKYLHYRSAAGYLSAGDAQVFYTAYYIDNGSANRPVTFVFNGGPGSASVWLHFGALGPVGINANEKKYSDNPDTWLSFTDLVFIDPVGTGYSRAADGVPEQKFHGYHQDIRAIAAFISQYLSVNRRKQSPLFLAGESYGGARAVGLAAYLQDSMKVHVNGLTLISPALNYQLVSFGNNNDMPYPYYLPTFTLAAQYHRRLPAKLQRLNIEQLTALSTRFAEGNYRRFLQTGDTITEALADSLSQLTGLSPVTIKQHNGRISDQLFSHELLANANERTGIYDSRATGTNINEDPTEVALRSAYLPAFRQYVGQQLRYNNQLPYLSTIATPKWDYGKGYLDVTGTLKYLLQKNPQLSVQVVSGEYDMATPPATVAASLQKLKLNSITQNQLTWHHYKAGHMLYTDDTVRSLLANDSKIFYQQTLVRH